MSRGIQALAVALLALAGEIGDASAQTDPALRGRVLEAGSGAPVAGATVRVGDTGDVPVISAADGRWQVGRLSPGEHRVSVQHLGHTARTLTVRVPTDHELVISLTPEALPLDAVVVTASRRMQRLADVPVTTELVTRREIEQTGASDLASVLTERTGVQLEGGHPTGAGVMLQGLGSERVLVLVDGQPFIGRISGQIDLSRLPSSMIERVEVVKGPQSTLYGTEAMGGVINVITREAPGRGWSAGAQLTAGTNGRVEAAGNARGNTGTLSYAADLGHRAVDLAPGVSGGAGAGAERWDGLAKVRWMPDSSLAVEASVLALDERQNWGVGQLFHFADNREWSTRMGAGWSRGVHRLAPTLYFTEFDHLSRRSLSPSPVAGTGQREVQRLGEAELLYSGQFGPHVLDAGLELRRETIRSDRVQDRERGLYTLDPFVQAAVAGDHWSVVPGVRVSWSEQWGTYWTPRLAALYRPLAPLALRASVGRGYRAPAFKELFLEFLNVGSTVAYAVRGNPELVPETSTNLTMGAEWTGSRVYMRGQLFHNRLEDFIETRLVGDSSGVTLYTYGNIADGTTQGLELEAGTTLGGARAEVGYSYLRAENRNSSEPLLGRPTHSGRISLVQTLPLSLRTSFTGIYTGSTPVRRTDAGIETRDSFLRFDLRMARSLPRGLEVTLGADNLLDTQPGDWPGYAGRHLYLGLGWRAAEAPALIPRR